MENTHFHPPGSAGGSGTVTPQERGAKEKEGFRHRGDRALRAAEREKEAAVGRGPRGQGRNRGRSGHSQNSAM